MYVLTPAPTLPVDRRTALRRLLLRTVQSAYGTIAFRNAILGGKLVTLPQTQKHLYIDTYINWPDLYCTGCRLEKHLRQHTVMILHISLYFYNYSLCSNTVLTPHPAQVLERSNTSFGPSVRTH